MPYVDFDFVVEPYPASMEAIQAEVAWWLNHHKIVEVEATVAALEGPNGWPLIRFSSHNKMALEAVQKAFEL